MDSVRPTIEELMHELEELERAIRKGELDGVDQEELNRLLDLTVEASTQGKISSRASSRTNQAAYIAEIT